MEELERKVLNTITQYGMLQNGDRIVVGLSGGADSSVLLHVLSKFAKEYNWFIVSAHINHGIRGSEAKRDQDFSEKISKELGVIYETITLSVPDYAIKNKISEETAGRKLRYEFFDNLCQKHNCQKIAVAHNMNDRAETVLINLIRGSGSNGLGGIKAINNKIVRPLIDVTRDEIETYALNQGINYVTDSTNNEDIYTRNIVRNKILPLMSEINSNVIKNIIRTSDIIKEESKLIDDVISEKININKDEKCLKINRKVFFECTETEKRRIILNVVRTMCSSTENISSAQIEELIKMKNTGNRFQFTNLLNVCITGEHIVFSKDEISTVTYEYPVSVNNSCYVKETDTTYVLTATNTYEKAPDALYFNADNIEADKLVLRTRRDGDVFQPSGMKGLKKVKKFFIDLKIPQSERDSYPLLTYNDDIIAIFPLRVSEKYKITKETKNIIKISIK